MIILNKRDKLKNIADCANATSIFDRCLKMIQYLSSNGSTTYHEFYDYKNNAELKKTSKALKELGYTVEQTKHKLDNKIGLTVSWDNPSKKSQAESYYELAKQFNLYNSLYLSLIKSAESIAKQGKYELTQSLIDYKESINGESFTDWILNKHSDFSKITYDAETNSVYVTWR